MPTWTSTLAAFARARVPYPLRVELARLRHAPQRARHHRRAARGRAGGRAFPHLLARRCSPLRRPVAPDDPRRDDILRHNVTLAAACIDRLVIPPGAMFSFHACVGRPSRLRGFRRGLELHDERLAFGVGGGVCKVSNLIYLLALLGGMTIVERHRHTLDLFPDVARTVPFGCGATVFYNYADLRFTNPLPQPVWLTIHLNRLRDQVIGALRTTTDPGWRGEVESVDDRFVRTPSGWFRENRIWRRLRRHDGTLALDEQVAHNRARVLYEPHVALPPPSTPSAIPAPHDAVATARHRVVSEPLS